jgi:3',5'-cyclic AMP phosphodiesterase CpdA
MGWIGDDQLSWLQADLEKTGKQTSIILVNHIPFYSVWPQVILGPKVSIGGKTLVNNVHDFRKMRRVQSHTGSQWPRSHFRSHPV